MRNRRPGPAKTPSVLAALRGNPGRRALNAREPKPALSDPEPPAWITADAIAVEVWREHAAELVRLGLLTRLDRRAFAAACKWWALYQRLEATLADPTVVSKNNGRQTKPEFRIALAAYQSAVGAFHQFGMAGPASRTHLVSGPDPDGQPSDFERLLREREQPGRVA